MERIWLDALEFDYLGGWRKETQFVRSVGQGYLIASDIPGTPVKNAETAFKVADGGMYRIFVRTKNWRLPEAPGRFKMAVDGRELPTLCGGMPNHNWYWEIAGDVKLEAGEHIISAIDKSGWLGRFSAVVITNDMDFTPTPEVERLLKQRAECKKISLLPTEREKFDLVIVGAGPGGFAAAISAARNGLKTALISGRPAVGGNASDEGTINMDGASAHHFGMHETGIANEIKATKEHFGCSVQKAMEMLLSAENNLTVYTNELCIDAETKNGKIISVTTVNTETLERFIYTADLFADCSGDGWLGYYAGAAYRLGREAKWEHNESLAPENPDTLTMSGCICDHLPNAPKMRTFEVEKTDEPQDFITPPWAIQIKESDIPGREPINFSKTEWWVENSNDYDDLWNDEFTRDEMLRLGVGYFGWLKNIYSGKEKTKNYRLKALALHLSKRESRRLIGDYILSENDYAPNISFPDTVSYCGWALDVHHPKGIFSGKEGPFLCNKSVPITPIPYRCLYSKNINNLFMAGRCCSVTHLGLGSVRVESTIATLGQVVGTAAALCVKHSVAPRGIYESHIKELQQLLIKQDMTIPGIKNEDKKDIAPLCKITATSFDNNYKMPLTYGFSGEWIEIENEHFCGPHWKNRFLGAEYYKVLVKNPGAEQKITVRLYHTDEKDIPHLTEEKTLILEKNYEGWLTLPLTPTSKGTGFLISITPTDKILWRQRAMSYSCLRHIYFENGEKFSEDFNAPELDYNSKTYALTKGEPKKIINGYTRPDDTDCNAWISSPAEAMPQSITLELPYKKEISSVQITTDTDLTYPRFAFQPPVTTVEPEHKSGYCAKELTLYILVSGKWKEVDSIKNNYRRQIKFSFAPLVAEAVKITVNSTSGESSVKLYEIRIY